MNAPTAVSVWISHLSGAVWIAKLDHAMPLADQAIVGCAVHPHAHTYNPRTRTWYLDAWRVPELIAVLHEQDVYVHGADQAAA